MDASQVDQPGTYAAKLAVGTDSPYPVTPVSVTMNGHAAGVVGQGPRHGDRRGQRAPIAGATVQICTMYDGQTGNCGPVTYTLKTDANGYYQLWLAQRLQPAQVIAAKDGYQPKARVVRITAGGTVTADFALKKSYGGPSRKGAGEHGVPGTRTSGQAPVAIGRDGSVIQPLQLPG